MAALRTHVDPHSQEYGDNRTAMLALTQELPRPLRPREEQLRPQLLLCEQQSRANAILFWSGRIESLAPFVDWAERNYHRVRSSLQSPVASYRLLLRDAHPQHVLGARFADGIHLLGYDVNRRSAIAVRAGQPLALTIESAPAAELTAAIEGHDNATLRRVQVRWQPESRPARNNEQRHTIRFRARAGENQTLLELVVLCKPDGGI